MQCKNLLLLVHPFFLTCLFLLIANDHWWKYTYSNTLTGKISDFAGVFVMAIFLVACLRCKRWAAIVITAIVFTWWKSPLSEPFMSAFHQLFSIRLSRVIDYTDLLALSILPLVFFIKPYTNFHFPAKIITCLSAAVSLTAMFATTLPVREFWRYPPGRVFVNKSWSTRLTEQQFQHKLDSLQIPYKKEQVEYLPVYTNGLMWAEKNSDSVFHMRKVDDLKDTILLYEKNLGEHYVIPYFVLERDTITNIRFRFYEERKRSYIEVMSMTIPPGMDYDYYMRRPVRKKYWALLKTFMK